MTLILDAHHLRVEYGRFVALPRLDLRLSAGDLMGLIGPNGAGKTTALRACCGQLPLAAGWVEVLGERIEAGNYQALSRIGFAPDNGPLYEEMKVCDFLRFVGRCYGLKSHTIEERVDFWLEQLWLTEKRQQKVKSLSRGMKQRLTVARTLMPDPVLVLLDEPAAGLDPAGRVQFRRLLASLRDQGKTLIVSSHILADLHEYCTHIGIMEGGRLRQFGTVAQVVGGQPDNRCRYEVTLAETQPEAAHVLAGIPALTAIQIHGRAISFEYEHEERAAAELLRRLMQAGLPVARFAPQEHDLEQAYLRTGIRQVD